MADAPVPIEASATPIEAAAPPKTMGELFADYNAQGALNGLFAPAYVKGYAPAEQAVADWNALNHGMNAQRLEQTRMPGEWINPDELQAAGPSFGKGTKMSPQGYDQYGSGRIPNRMSLLDKGGIVDPEALRVMAQGGQYDMEGRRAAIAQRLAANAGQQSAYDANKAKAVNPYNPWAGFPPDLGFDL
jgi:hypothetical protein